MASHPSAPPFTSSRVRTAATAGPQGGVEDVLEVRAVFRRAQAILAERAGGSVARAAHVLLNLGAQFGLPTAEAAGGFFLACAAPDSTDAATQRLVARVIAAARPLSEYHQEHRLLLDMDARDQARDYHVAQLDQASLSRTTVPLCPAIRRDSSGIAVTGDLDASTAEQLEAAVRQRRVVPGDTVLLNLRALTFCDTSGLRALVAAHSLVTDAGGGVRVVAPAALGPLRVLHLAVARRWLPGEFAAPTTAGPRLEVADP